MIFPAIRELLSKYLQVIFVSWSARRELTPVHRTKDELSFLPASLELQDSPPHPAARITLWALLAFILIALIWAYFGQIDMVAVAPGKLVVSDQSKTIQSLDAGVIKAIHVRDGQVVRTGDLIIELDSTLTGAESHKNNEAWLDARLDVLRAQALISALKNNTPPQLADDPALHTLANISSRRPSAQQEMLSSWQEFQAKLATVNADTLRKQAERSGAQDQVSKLEQTLPIMCKDSAVPQQFLH